MPIATFILLILITVLLCFLAVRFVKDSPDRAELSRLADLRDVVGKRK